jgi:hypothetical protein
VERTFGVLKRRFKVLTAAQEYPIDFQARLVSALAVIHNFIRIHDPREPEDEYDDEPEDEDNTEDEGNPGDNMANSSTVHGAERGRAADRRERIAQNMWRDYQIHAHD